MVLWSDMTTPNLRRIRLVAFDVDGVLTDGAILLGPSGEEWKAFNVKDGLAIARAVRAGLEIAFISGRNSAAVTKRAQELGAKHCIQNCNDKKAELTRLTRKLKLQRDHVAYVGDDLNDLPAFDASGLCIAVADAAPELKGAADFVTKKQGGRGATREVLEMILKARGSWETNAKERQ